MLTIIDFDEKVYDHGLLPPAPVQPVNDIEYLLGCLFPQSIDLPPVLLGRGHHRLQGLEPGSHSRATYLGNSWKLRRHSTRKRRSNQQGSIREKLFGALNNFM
jgi:hypothetical protein